MEFINDYLDSKFYKVNKSYFLLIQQLDFSNTLRN